MGRSMLLIIIVLSSFFLWLFGQQRNNTGGKIGFRIITQGDNAGVVYFTPRSTSAASWTVSSHRHYGLHFPLQCFLHLDRLLSIDFSSKWEVVLWYIDRIWFTTLLGAKLKWPHLARRPLDSLQNEVSKEPSSLENKYEVCLLSLIFQVSVYRAGLAICLLVPDDYKQASVYASRWFFLEEIWYHFNKLCFVAGSGVLDLDPEGERKVVFPLQTPSSFVNLGKLIHLNNFSNM